VKASPQRMTMLGSRKPNGTRRHVCERRGLLARRLSPASQPARAKRNGRDGGKHWGHAPARQQTLQGASDHLPRGETAEPGIRAAWGRWNRNSPYQISRLLRDSYAWDRTPPWPTPNQPQRTGPRARGLAMGALQRAKGNLDTRDGAFRTQGVGVVWAARGGFWS